MIERQIIAQKMKENLIREIVFAQLGKLSCSHIELQRTPLGEKIVVYTSRPGLIVGRKGANIKEITTMLKDKLNMENPQLEVAEINHPELDATTIAKKIVGTIERFGPKRFKSVAYKALEDVIRCGAMGAEIVISGRGLPGVRAKSWRFTAGYLKKSGDIAESIVDKANEACYLKSGTIGVKVSVLHPDTKLPDSVKLIDSVIEIEEIKKEVEKEEIKKPKEKKLEVKEKPKKDEIKILEKEETKVEEVKQ